MSESSLRRHDLLAQAENEFLFSDKKEVFFFDVRRKPGVLGFYEQLDRELRQQELFSVAQYREVKEGFVKVSRPATLKLSLATLLKEKPHLKLLKDKLDEWQLQYSFVPLKLFVEKNKDEALKDFTRTQACLETYKYLSEHKEEIIGLLPRQIPHGNSTKLIGKEPLLLKIFSFSLGQSQSWKEFYEFFGLQSMPPEFRFYAPQVKIDGQSLRGFHGVIAQDTLNRFDFSACGGTLIMENWQSFYGLSRANLSCLLIWGGGWKVSLLKSHLKNFPGPIYYWGDIDKEGLEIYGLLKIHFPALRSILMDESSFSRFQHLKQKKEAYFGPFRPLGELQEWYQKVCENGWQIEQEQLSISDEEFASILKI